MKDVPAAGLFGVMLFDSGATAAGIRLTARGSGITLNGTGHVAKGNQVIGSGSGLFRHRNDGFALTTWKGCRLVGNSSQRNEGNGFGIFADSSSRSPSTRRSGTPPRACRLRPRAMHRFSRATTSSATGATGRLRRVERRRVAGGGDGLLLGRLDRVVRPEPAP